MTAKEMLSFAYTEHKYGADPRDLFRTLLLTIESGMPVDFIRFIFLLLREYGVDEVHKVLNKDTILAAETIHLATYNRSFYRSSPLGASALVSMPRLARKMIHYALISGDSQTVANIVRDRNPDTLHLLKELHREHAEIATPLHTGVL
jgi:hypothetical protein